MNNKTGADLLMSALQDENVDTIFGYPGGSALHIYDAIYRQKTIQHILVRHEQAATHAADAYSRSTGKTGVVIVTSGPGATNAITGIATAFMDSIPMIVISGQVHLDKIGEDAFQETDMIGISRPIVKHSYLVKDPLDIPDLVKKAFHIANTGRPGPVVIDLPKNITGPEEIYSYNRPDSINLRSYKLYNEGDKNSIDQAIKLIYKSCKPVIYAGGGVNLGNASKELQEFASRTKCPVTLTLMGLGCFPGDDHQFLGMLGMHGSVVANYAMHDSDLIIALGVRFDDRVTNKISNFCPNAKIIHVDIDPTSISKIIQADIPIVGSVKTVLQQLNTEIIHSNQEKEDLTPWWKTINLWKETYNTNDYSIAHEDLYTIKPQHAVRAVYEVTRGDAFITSDVGQHQMFAAQHYIFNKPRRWINSGGLGTMGFGLPAAMGVKIAHPDETVVCITGEGSIQMCIQELSTCTQYNLPIKIICLNNGNLGMVKQWQDINYDSRYSEITYEDSLPDFVKLAESYGHVGIRISQQSDLESKLQYAFSLKEQVVFIDILVADDEHVYPMQVLPNGSMRDMKINKGELAS
ncbi:acetolactate synthase large subunit [Sinobacterium caligoides]|uniref:Acetolactate synthase n=1 Tax=Sinobacterium caligoides TaxID=933926 RepID=A0A3N2E1I7_9GAMM|nr:biosynthetic-type acetolactate synthase large subunit [Sinobacterium caligoides]ROS05519.1 acetolactate synthase large subunit [Sinobacterium caligoides]